MKFITLILSALMVLGVVTGSCYKNGENPPPECDLGGPCQLALEILLTGKVKERFDQCRERGAITKAYGADCPEELIYNCIDALTELDADPKV